jgi:hypothetical protein
MNLMDASLLVLAVLVSARPLMRLASMVRRRSRG